MQYKLDHIAIACKDLKATVAFYENLFGGKATEIRMGSGGYEFCYIKINGVDTVQLFQANSNVGLNHYGFVAENLEAAAEDFKVKGHSILRELRDRRSGKLTAVFLEDPNGVEIEIRNPR
jgi:methylmalonyl-CoA/ethylmalonyl-CoA epimerase